MPSTVLGSVSDPRTGDDWHVFSAPVEVSGLEGGSFAPVEVVVLMGCSGVDRPGLLSATPEPPPPPSPTAGLRTGCTGVVAVGVAVVKPTDVLPAGGGATTAGCCILRRLSTSLSSRLTLDCSCSV